MARKTPEKKPSPTYTPPPSLPSQPKFYCCRCGCAYSRQKGYFPVSHSPMYRGSGYLPWCNECVEELYNQYKITLRSDKDAMHRVCMKFDLYWNESIYEMAEKTSGTNSRIRNYIGKTNIVRYIDKTYDDTLKEMADASTTADSTVEFADDPQPTKEPEEPIEIPEELVDFWGAGLDPDLYPALDKRYKKWVDGMDESQIDIGESTLYKQICMLEEKIVRDTARGRDTDKNVKMLNELLGSVNRKPSQKKDDSSSLNEIPFGVGIGWCERRRPIAEPDPSFEDVDGIRRYISIWLYGHLAKMMGKKNLYSKLYEDEIAKMRVERPEQYTEDDEAFIYDVLSEEDTD